MIFVQGKSPMTLMRFI